MTTLRPYLGLLSTVVLLLAGSDAAAQEFRATVRGRSLTGAKRRAGRHGQCHEQGHERNRQCAHNTGELHDSVPPPGALHRDVELSGFQKYTRTDMQLQVGETATINVQLAVGAVTENVTVSAESPTLETSNASRGTVIDSQKIAELPLQSRSPMALVVLVAGVNYNAQAVYLRPFDNGALAAWSMNGGASSNNEFLLDGAPNNANQGGNNIAYMPPAEAVAEMKISTNSYDAQYGRTAGGVVNMSLKSGTNAFHGVVYDFMRRKALAANSFLLNSQNRSPRPISTSISTGSASTARSSRTRRSSCSPARSTGKARPRRSSARCRRRR